MPHSHYPQIQPFLDYLKFEKRYSQHTIVSYQNDIEQFFQFLISQFDAPGLKDIRATFIRSWLAEMRAEKISPKTLNRKISSLKSFFKNQVKLGVIAQTPMTTIVSPKMNKRLPSFVAQHEMENLRSNVEFPATWKGRTDELVLNIFYNTGMRLSELVNLKESSIDASNSQLKVLGKGNKERIIPVSVDLINQITDYTREKRKIYETNDLDVLFLNEKGKPLYAKYVYLIVRKNLSQVTTLQKKSPHVLRHTFATHLTNNGADLNAVKELLGHSSLAATQVYTHNTIDKLKDIYKKAHPKA
jgi:integrase/recombinase XerC